MNPLQHLNKLSDIKSNTGIHFLSPAAFPGSHCPLHTAMMLAGSIKDVSTLVVGTNECSYYSRLTVPKDSTGLHWNYILDDSEVVFGCREGIIDSIKELDENGAKNIMIMTTCLPELVGEDLEGIVYEVKDEVDAKVAFVNIAHFKCNSFPSGTWKVLNALESFVDTAEEKSDTVNILGWHPEGAKHVPEIVKILQDNDVTLRYFAPGMDVKTIENAADAKISIVLSPMTASYASKLEKSHDVPQVTLYDQYLITEIKEAYKNIEDILNIELVYDVSAEMEAITLLEDSIKEKHQKYKYVISDLGMNHVLSILPYLNTLDMEPILIHLEDFETADIEYIKELEGTNVNPYTAHFVDIDADTEIINEIKPDFVIGPEPIQSSSNTPYIKDLGVLFAFIGFEKTKFLLDSLDSTLKVVSQNGVA